MTCISDLVRDRARETPDAPALIDEQGVITWATLETQVLHTTAWLQQNGARRGDHIAILCPNRPAYIVIWLAIANLGGVAVSVNVGLIGDGLRYAVTLSRATLIVAERAMLTQMRDDLAPVLAMIPVATFTDETDLARQSADLPPASHHTGPGSAPVSIIYTSGTTGRPKAVLNSHTAFIACGHHTVDMLQVTQNDRIMLFLPLFHANPLMYGLMSALHTGAALVIRPKFSASRFLDDAKAFNCTIFTFVGTVLAMLCNRIKTPDQAHRLTRCVGGGCPAELWQTMQDRFGIRVHELYGMTEIGGWVTANTTSNNRIGTCGQVRADMRVQIVDDHDHPVATGQRGEIVVRPEAPDVILNEYWDNADATLQSFRNLWFHTGDIGSFDHDGYLTFHGRTKEIIRRGGENISPVDIEQAALAHPAVSDAAAVGVPDPVFGEEIKIVVVARQNLAARELHDHMAQLLAKFMVPRYLQFTTEIPKTETEKIQRHKLPGLPGHVADMAKKWATP